MLFPAVSRARTDAADSTGVLSGCGLCGCATTTWSATRRRDAGVSGPRLRRLIFLKRPIRGDTVWIPVAGYRDENEFLSSSVEKMLAGYPVDGIPESKLGKLHATPIFTDALTPAFGETWTTSAVYGVGGISGGPLFARHSNGTFYLAAIYLGGAGQAVVRAIDSDVVDLSCGPRLSGNGGENNTGGGITHTSVAGNISATDPGALRVVIEPASATTKGAGWQLVPESTWRQGGSLKSGLTSKYNLLFKPVDGFQAPKMQMMENGWGQFTTAHLPRSLNDSASLWRQMFKTHFGQRCRSHCRPR